MIAENKVPFEKFVKFTMYVDGKEFSSLEASCPEFCANDSMYSRSFTIPDGDYSEVYVAAEDGNGAKGKSVSYQYAKTQTEVSYFAESCPLDLLTNEYHSVSRSGPRNIYYGGTITDGWPENTDRKSVV